MYNYTEIMRLARKKDIKLKESTLRKDLSNYRIKPEKYIMMIAYFKDEDIERYFELKKAAALRVGRPNIPFTVNGLNYKSEKDFMEKTGNKRGAKWRLKNKGI